MTNNWLPTGYKIPDKQSNYLNMREEGDYTFRIMSSPILGYEAWSDNPEGGRTPKRTPMNKPFDLATDGVDPADIKHFWAFIVWNYKAEMLQIMEITQSTIQKAIKALVSNAKWGDPKGADGYDIVITRSGLTMQDTNYSVTPNPKEKLDKKVVEAYEKANINLEALFESKDPFETKDIEIPEGFGK